MREVGPRAACAPSTASVASMDLRAPDPDAGDPARLDLEASRACERLRTMSLVRLAASRPGARTRAADAFALAQDLVDMTADLLAGERRTLPPLPDASAGDVLAVCAHDLACALRDAPGDPRALATCRRAVEQLVALRLSL